MERVCGAIEASYVGQLHLLAVIHAGDGGLSLRHNVIVVHVVGQQTLGYVGVFGLGSVVVVVVSQMMIE